MGEHRELERKLRTPRPWTVADVAGLRGLAVAGVTAVEERPAVHLDALYFDTAALHLLRAGASLRRRTGGDDAGWHLKLPAADGSRTEVHHPCDDDTDGIDESPPAALAALVVGLARGRPLVPVARLQTRRLPIDLRDGDGRTVVELALDDVVATILGDDPRTRTWSELEAELASGPDAALDAVVGALVRGGAELAPGGPKIVVAFGPEAVVPSPPSMPRPSDGAGPRLSGASSAGEVVAAYLRTHAHRFLACDPDVRRDVPDSIHQARVATRRVRAALAGLRPLLDAEITEPLRDELRWWCGVLSPARDAEVRRERLEASLDALPGAMVVGGARDALLERAREDYREARARAIELSRGVRYLTMLERLESLATDPPLRGEAAGAADRVLPALLRRQWRRVRAWQHAALAAPEAHREAQMHALRRAAKRARYVAEAVAPAIGQRAVRLARRLDTVQDALGTARDADLLGDTLRREAARAHDEGADTFTYGVLAQVERSRAQHARERYRDAWERLAR